MARYHIIVGETRVVEMLYVVEANSPVEAEGKAERGETVKEEEMASNYRLIDRNVIENEGLA